MSAVVSFVCLGILVLASLAQGRIFDFNQDWRSENDRVTDLPELHQTFSFGMFSGYLQASSSKWLHYWYNECVDPTSDVLIVWFNGGPGCSSLDGLFTEHGPFKFDSFGNLVENHYSWNKLGHTLYIESPVGVGFSYASDYDGPLNDDTTAHDNLQALKDFFLKFPSRKDSKLYISGESYAGVYVPMLLREIFRDGTYKDNVKGAMIGNGLLNIGINDESLVYFAYYHGIFGPHLFKEIVKYCCNGVVDNCNFNSIPSVNCILKLSRAQHIVANNGLNIYNLYADCYSEAQGSMARSLEGVHFTAMEERSYDEVLEMEKASLLYDEQLNLVPPCSNATFITNYLNRRDVQHAIHVEERDWQICNRSILNKYKRNYPDMSDTIKNIMQDHYDVQLLFYFGDTDMACNHLGGEWFLDQLGYEIVMPRRKWTVNTMGVQVAGYFKQFDRITFATVKGAGHMVPADKPQEAFEMIQRFMADEPL